MSADARGKALSALARFHVTEASVGQTLQRIADVTLEAIPSASIAGMSMLDDDARPTTAVYTDEESPDIDAAQYRHGKGPCLDAWRERRVVRLDRVADHAEKYPEFTAACRQHGVLSTLSLPMVGGDTSIGALNLYARSDHAFTDDDQAIGGELAGVAGSVLANVAAYWTVFDLSQQLNEAMQSRAVIEQAKGMLMAQSPELSSEDAFDVLRRASQRENVKLREIARRLVERRAPAPREQGSRTP